MHQDEIVVDSRKRLKLGWLLLAIQLKCAFINKKVNYRRKKKIIITLKAKYRIL